MTPVTGPLLDALFSTAEVTACLDDRARLQGMLDFEAALAAAEAAAGVIPAASAEAIARACHAERFDLAALGCEAADAGNPAIPMVKRLTTLVAEADPEAARAVHLGATSQDAMDTGLVLQLRAALAAMAPDQERLASALARLAETHAATPMIGRTWLVQAVPVTFGLKAAGWLSAVERGHRRLDGAARAARTLQFGGAVGTLAALGDRGLDVAAALAARLDLDLPDLPWHASRDRLVDLGAALGTLTGTLGKVARDLALLAQTEVGEASEPAREGRGGSSTMPHKRNPVACAVALGAAARVPPLVATLLATMPQEHERGLGGWHAEWETLPEIVRLTAGALRQMAGAMEGLVVDPGRMRANLDTTRGLVMAEAVATALAEHLGRAAAHGLVEAACRRAIEEGTHLRDVLARDPTVTAHLSAERLADLFVPDAYLGMARRLVERALDARRRTS